MPACDRRSALHLALGLAFHPEYAALCDLREMLFPEVPVRALTATADKLTRVDIAVRLFAHNVGQSVLGFNRSNIRSTVEKKGDWR